MKKYRIVKLAGYKHLYKVQRLFFGFLWVTVLNLDFLEDCRRYIHDKKNPVVEYG